MRSMQLSKQLRATRHSVHTVGITEDGILYIDVQRFAENRTSGARTFYVRAADVERIKRLATGGVESMTNPALVKLLAASFHSAQYALEWLRWAGIPTVRCLDEHASHNAEEKVPRALLC